MVEACLLDPLPFGDAVDLDRYPRPLDGCCALLEEQGVDLVFAPPVEEVYPGGEPLVRVTAGSLGEKWEGASRPGHFDGALTVVAKLLHYGIPGSGLPPAGAFASGGGGLPAYRAYFGQKDAQQLALVRRMVADLNFPVEIIAVPTVRSEDGLALSSRNRFLSAEERAAGLGLSRALRLPAAAAEKVEFARDICTLLLKSASSGPLVVPSCVVQNSTCICVPVVTPNTLSGSFSSLKLTESTMPRPLLPPPQLGLMNCERLNHACVADTSTESL